MPFWPPTSQKNAAPTGLLLLLPLLSPAAEAATSSGPHIADLNVLLPLSSPAPSPSASRAPTAASPVFVRSWDHHDILSVKPEYNDSSRCSTSARLTSILPYTCRKETAVYATDRRTGITIRCKVFIDKILRIQIFHHAVKIDLDELVLLNIRAFDDEENVFSSLVGLKFRWQLEPKSSESSAIHHLVHVLLKETSLSDCGGFCRDLDTQKELENKLPMQHRASVQTSRCVRGEQHFFGRYGGLHEERRAARRVHSCQLSL